MIEREIKKNFHGFVSLRTNDVQKGKIAGGIIIKHNGDQMILDADQLKQLKPNNQWYTSKYPPYTKYQLYDIRWNPKILDKNQLSLI